MQWPIPPFPTKIVAGDAVNVNGSAPNSKGAWVTLLTLPADRPASWLNLGNDQISASGDRAALMDIGIGSAGSETILAANLVVGYRDHGTLAFPLHIPAGATIRARLAGAVSMNIWTTATAYVGEPDCGLSVPGRITTYGVVASPIDATNVTPSGTLNVKGSYAQITAATTAPIHALMVLAQSSTSTPTDTRYAIDIAVGSPGNETIIVPNHYVRVENSPVCVYPQSPPFVPLSTCIPAGVRLAARCSIWTGSSAPIEVAVYGFTY
ncbi:hypothetical protein [Nonomuraea rhodomycinica]|uniref:Uncharacterized protein n=1 Tax=Nonomuraea rhodomycinica TaxID=1712872 RepID=A0A7Y6IWW9_9ACTN|nr:hypothetical protein [Nonomuraea rhodomycinica]NUW45561.1 hypothetical protein [Nonomuraea rhodomycinica]